MPFRWRNEDPGLPISFGQCSNGEYHPEPVTALRREMERTARRDIDQAVTATGVSRRDFLRSASAAAICLGAIDTTVTRWMDLSPGRFYPLEPDARYDTDSAREALGSPEFVFDVQGHLLEYDLDPSTRGDYFWGSQFPQARCEEEEDPRACFATNHFLEEFFIRSDTSMVALSGLPINPEGSPLSNEVMEETRQLVVALAGDERVVVNALVLPQTASVTSVAEEMERTAAEQRIAGWKTFTHYGGAWWLDDHDPGLPQVGHGFLDRVVALDIPIVFVHKGLSGRARYGSPIDVGPAAAAHPDVSFVVYHSGFEVAVREGPYRRTGAGVDRLIRSLQDAGIGQGRNVYAELGSTWWHLLRRPNEAAHVLGKLLLAVGENNILWGTDSIFYGSPQGQIEAFRAFAIPVDMQERFGYPPLTEEVKGKILGWNAARLYDLEPITEPIGLSLEEIRSARAEHLVPTRTWGPETTAAVRRFREHHRGWP